jgi:hypothetical protein
VLHVNFFVSKKVKGDVSRFPHSLFFSFMGAKRDFFYWELGNHDLTPTHPVDLQGACVKMNCILERMLAFSKGIVSKGV